MSFSGGCQCGAIRFRAEALGSASICHCRMCQKAMGGFYGPFVTVKAEHLTWTRGAPAHFQSSNKVSRGFCTACGTPLTFEQVAGQTELAIGAFDDPAAIRPKGQFGQPAPHALDRRTWRLTDAGAAGAQDRGLSGGPGVLPAPGPRH